MAEFSNTKLVLGARKKVRNNSEFIIKKSCQSKVVKKPTDKVQKMSASVNLVSEAKPKILKISETKTVGKKSKINHSAVISKSLSPKKLLIVHKTPKKAFGAKIDKTNTLSKSTKKSIVTKKKHLQEVDVTKRSKTAANEKSVINFLNNLKTIFLIIPIFRLQIKVTRPTKKTQKSNSKIAKRKGSMQTVLNLPFL